MTTTRHALRAALTASALLMLAPAAGCLVTSSSSTRYSGNRVESGADMGVVLGESSPAEAIAILGEPSSRVSENGRDVLTWRWTEERNSNGSVFLVFGGSSETTHEKAVHIAFEDGVAVKRWRD